MTVLLPINNCSKCPHWDSSRYYTADSWEHANNWWCTNPNVEEVHTPQSSNYKEIIFIKEDKCLEKLRLIRGYVETFDKVPVPTWCPLEKR